MNYSSTICKCYIIICYYIESCGVVLKEIKKSYISCSLKVCSLECLYYLIVFLKKGLYHCLGKYEHLSLIAYLAVVLMGVYNKGYV